MQVPLQINFRHMDASSADEARIRQRCHKLEQFAEYITRCRITIEAPFGYHHQNGLYTVTIQLTLTDGELTVSRPPEQYHAHKDMNVAIRDAFDTARNQLEDYVRRRRAEIMLHASVS